jgi:hypothetical protein
MRLIVGQLATTTKALWLLCATGQAALIATLIAHKSFRVYPAFFAYIMTSLMQAVVLLMVFLAWGFNSPVSSRAAWVTQYVVVCVRALAVAEVSRHLLSRFVGIWALAGRILRGAAAVVLYALIAASQRGAGLGAAEASLELAIAGGIVGLLLFARYYQVPLKPPVRALAAGLCFYSCISALNDMILERWFLPYASLWNLLGMATFLGCLSVWMWAFRKPVSPPKAGVAALDGSVYRSISPEINLKLLQLNEQLSRFWRAEAPRT